jgi:hypothetical protein
MPVMMSRHGRRALGSLQTPHGRCHTECALKVVIDSGDNALNVYSGASESLVWEFQVALSWLVGGYGHGNDLGTCVIGEHSSEDVVTAKRGSHGEQKLVATKGVFNTSSWG